MSKLNGYLLRFLMGTALAVLVGSPYAEEEPGLVISQFQIKHFEVKGNTLLPQETIDALLAPFTGVNRDFDSLERALEALEAAYQARGFNLVQVVLPEQRLDDGQVELRVIEKKIDRVLVQDNQHFDEGNIRKSVPGLVEGANPNLAAISTTLRSANENPAKKVTLQMQSADAEDRVNAILKVVDEKPTRFIFGLDNTGETKTGRARATFAYQDANVANLDHILNLQYTTSVANPSKVSLFGAGYHIPFNQQGNSLDFFASYSDVDSGAIAVGDLNLLVSGRGKVAGARFNHRLDRSGNIESILHAGLEIKAFSNDISLASTPLARDITVHPLSVGYGLTWMSGAQAFRTNLTLVKNLPGGDNGGADSFAFTRTGASKNYTLFRYGADYTQSLPNDWKIRLGVNGQTTDDALVPGEQFGVGGSNSVRGFDERELADDKGFNLNAEIYTPNLCGGINPLLQCRILAFYDAGQTWRNQAFPGETTKNSVASVGLGWRMLMSKYFSMQMDYGHIIDAAGTKEKGDHRLHMKIGLSY